VSIDRARRDEGLKMAGRVDHPEQAPISRLDMEEFLFTEAALLDSWRLDEWLELFDEDSVYLVPATDAPQSEFGSAQFLIGDNYADIQARVTRLKSRKAHAENPRSRTRRLLGNVLIESVDPDGGTHVTASFVVYRMKYNVTSQFIGQYRHVMVRTDGGLKFRQRMAVIDQESLDVDGRVSIIL
jgi:p-cumate 2,3-dioxygenase beta subunit